MGGRGPPQWHGAAPRVVCMADAELRLPGADDPAFAVLRAEYADVLGGAPPGLPPDRGMELVIETGDTLMPRSRPVKRLSEGGLAGLRTQLVDLLDRGWIQLSMAGRAGSAVFALTRKPDGTWRICNDYLGLHAVSRPAVGLHRTSTSCSTVTVTGYAGVVPLHLAQSGQQLPLAAGTGFGPVKGEFSLAAGPVRVERGAVRAPGVAVISARHERGTDRQLGSLPSCSWRRHAGGVGPAGARRVGSLPNCPRRYAGGGGAAGAVRVGIYGRLSGPFVHARTAPARRGGGA
jgi:hypothetical protein